MNSWEWASIALAVLIVLGLLSVLWFIHLSRITKRPTIEASELAELEELREQQDPPEVERARRMIFKQVLKFRLYAANLLRRLRG